MSRTYSTIFYKKLIICFILIAAVIFDIIVSLLIFIPNWHIITDLFIVYNFIQVLTIFIILRIFISLYGTKILWQQWLKQRSFSLFNIPFLFGLFFAIFLVTKTLDLMIYILYRMYLSYSYPYDTALFISKIRYFLGLFSTIPIFLIGLYLYLYKKNLFKEEFDINTRIKRNATLCTILYSSLLVIMLSLINNIQHISFLILICVCCSFSFSIWFFIVIHRAKRLPEINSLIISVGLICYLIVQLVNPLIVNLVMGSSFEGDILAGIYYEISPLIPSLIIVIGFRIKANYN
ncbi:MAG: hypothetical protein ACFFCE_05810 [Promethearchaeota archaeon]